MDLGEIAPERPWGDGNRIWLDCRVDRAGSGDGDSIIRHQCHFHVE